MVYPCVLLVLGVIGSTGCEEVALPIPGPFGQPGQFLPPGQRAADGGFAAPDAGWPPVNPGPSQCTPPLQLEPSTVITTPVALTSFRASGGTGHYVFDLLKFESGGRINESTGAYLSGETPMTEDIVRLRDTNCIGTSSVTISIVDNMNVQPEEANIPPFTSFQIQVSGGSGTYSFVMHRSPSGGAVSPTGEYTSGSRSGEDIIRITDDGSGEFYNLHANVDVNAEVTANPSEVHVPVGNEYKMTITGGSGHYRLVSDNPDIDLEKLTVFSDIPGTVAFQIEDTFTGQVGDAFISFVLPQSVTTTRGGDLSQSGHFHAPGDINNDQMLDAILGLPEGDSTGHNAGAVFVYLGNGTSLDDEPAQIIGGRGRDDGFGAVVRTGDLTQDGIDDLVVAAPRADVNAIDSGGIFIYRGTQDQLYEPVRLQAIGGRAEGDGFGTGLTLCDFNGDGRLDIAVSAPFAEDRGIQNIRTDQGAIYIFLNHEEFGFLSNADQIFYGSLRRNGGVWTGEANLRLGTSIASGDFNNDGRCELAISSRFFNNNGGLVYMHVGNENGVSTRPRFAYQGEANTQTGRKVIFGDITDDDRDELIVSQHAQAGGTVHVFRGQSMVPEDEIETIESINTSDWKHRDIVVGNSAGWDITTADTNNDNIQDLVFSRIAGELTGGTVNAGTISIFTGRSGPLPSLFPWKEYAGLGAGDQFGLSVAVIGDIDGDRLADFVSLASTADLYGPQVGVPYYVPGNPGLSYESLKIPAAASGIKVGAGLAVIDDLNNDRDSDLVVGAPLVDLRNKGLDSGAAFIYLGGIQGFDRTASLTIDNFPELSTGDQFGTRVVNIGDFDGDGIGDFAITAPFDDAPGQFGSHLEAAGCRAQGRTNSGAVFIFRGSSAGMPSTQPAFVYWGAQANAELNMVAGNFDFNSDGKMDIGLGMPNFNRGNRGDAGLFVILHGREADAQNKTIVLCGSDFQFRGFRANDRLGNNVTSMKDVDNDGCGDVAVSSPGEGPLSGGQDTNEGYIRVFFGGAVGCTQPEPVMVAFGSEETNARAGFVMAGGLDVDGDTIPDLAVSSIDNTVAAETVGTVWLISGDHILSTPTIPNRDDLAPTSVRPFAPVGSTTVFRTNGQTASGLFGQSLELIPGASGPDTAGIAIGAPRYHFSGIPLTGAVLVFRFNRSGNTSTPRGISPTPFVAMSGETSRSGGLMGTAIGTGEIAGKTVVVVGGELSSGNSIDQGAVYIMVPDSL